MKIDILTKADAKNVQKTIIAKIGDLINLKNLEPGDKLPSERMLSEKFNVSRSNVREAIQKLEFYGLLNSIPQSGTFVANILGSFLIGLILGYFAKNQTISQSYTLLLATGFCGGFTTFSSFAFENQTLLKAGDFTSFALYTIGSIIFGFLAVFAGIYLVKFI